MPSARYDFTRFPGPVVLRDAVLPGIGHEDAPGRADRDVGFRIEVLPAVHGELPDERPVAVEDLDAVVAGVRHVDAAVAVGRDADGLDELAGSVARRAPGGGDFSVRVELDDPLVPRIGDVEESLREHHAAGAEEAAVRVFPFSEPTPVRRETDDAVVPGVRHVNLAAGPDRHAARLVELPLAGARPAAEQAQECAVSVEDLHAAVLGIGDVEVSAGVGRDAARLGELPGAGARAADHARGRKLLPLGGIVARGRVLNGHLERFEDSAAFGEVLAHEDGGILRADGAPDLVEEPPPHEVLQRGPGLSGLGPAFGEPPGPDGDPPGVVLRGELLLERAFGVPVGDDDGCRGLLDPARPCGRHVAQIPRERPGALAGDRDHVLAGGDAGARLLHGRKRPDQILRRLYVGEHLGVAGLLLRRRARRSGRRRDRRPRC